MLQTCRALDIQGLYSQALEILNTAGATGGNLKISEQAVRLCLLTAAWQDLPRWSEQYRQHFAAHISRGVEYRPAPLILSWLGYLNTLGTDFVDGVIADPRVLPADEQPAYCERILHLPGLFTPTSRLPVATPYLEQKRGGVAGRAIRVRLL